LARTRKRCRSASNRQEKSVGPVVPEIDDSASDLDNEQERKLVQSKDIKGLKYFDMLLPLLEPLHDEQCARDKANNRELHYDQYCMLVLLYIFNPTVICPG
jgi:hypothetical protein